MATIKHIMPSLLYEKKSSIEIFLQEELSPLVNDKTWVKEWRHIAERFKLFKFKELSKEEAADLEWDQAEIEKLIYDTVEEAELHLPYNGLMITVFPAFPFPWFQNHSRSLWTNGYTNGPNNILIAVPPNPDKEFLQYLVAHELHHATPINPIYELTLETFTLSEWFKMEGGAELFSLSLYPDKRWWKSDFTPDREAFYWEQVKGKLATADDREKSLLCFGKPSDGIPYLAGYSFAYNLFLHYIWRYPEKSFRDLLQVGSLHFIENYKIRNIE